MGHATWSECEQRVKGTAPYWVEFRPGGLARRRCTLEVARSRQQSCGRQQHPVETGGASMGDKGGKKDKEKNRQQQEAKRKEQQKQKDDKRQPKAP
jgi:hypothetical protein